MPLHPHPSRSLTMPNAAFDARTAVTATIERAKASGIVNHLIDASLFWKFPRVGLPVVCRLCAVGLLLGFRAASKTARTSQRY